MGPRQANWAASGNRHNELGSEDLEIWRNLFRYREAVRPPGCKGVRNLGSLECVLLRSYWCRWVRHLPTRCTSCQILMIKQTVKWSHGEALPCEMADLGWILVSATYQLNELISLSCRILVSTMERCWTGSLCLNSLLAEHLKFIRMNPSPSCVFHPSLSASFSH